MLLQIQFYSDMLNKKTGVNVLLPQNGTRLNAPYKTLWLLHGLQGDHTSWLSGCSIERYAARHNLAVVMPDAGRSWYTNTMYGARYFDMIADELPALCRNMFWGMSDRREDNLVGGLSMGGYGACKLALTYPERYGACISLSGAVDITRKGRPYILDEWRSLFGYQLESALELEGSEHDLFMLAQRNKQEGKPFPAMYLWCGLQDGLIHHNRQFHQHLEELDVPHTYAESEGDHTWPWWDLHIQDGLQDVLNKL